MYNISYCTKYNIIGILLAFTNLDIEMEHIDSALLLLRQTKTTIQLMLAI
jgi:hypothetical protein